MLRDASAIATILGLLVAVTSWYLERRTRKRLEIENQRRIWSDISKVRGLMVDLEKDQVAGARGDGGLQAVGKLTFMLRDLVREACMAEKDFSVETVAKWRAVGKLGSDWQEHLALMMLRADEIDVSVAKALAYKHAATDELPEGHPMRAPKSLSSVPRVDLSAGDPATLESYGHESESEGDN